MRWRPKERRHFILILGYLHSENLLATVSSRPREVDYVQSRGKHPLRDGPVGLPFGLSKRVIAPMLSASRIESTSAESTHSR